MISHGGEAVVPRLKAVEKKHVCTITSVINGRIQKNVDNKMNQLQKELPSWAKFEHVYSQNERIEELFSDLTKEVIIAIVLLLNNN